jgi:2-dehydropantoate 2-reductase
MHVIIVGAGALGSLYAACLARDGHAVSLVARGERARALAVHGIRVTGVEDFSARCDIVTEPQQLRSADLLILATKTYDTAEALQSLRDLRVTSAFSVQNGVQKNEALAQAFGASAALGAISMIGAELLPAQGDMPGAVRYTRVGATTIGEIAGGLSPRVEEWVGAMTRAGLNVLASDRITAIEWSKFVTWSGSSALAVLTRLPPWRFLLDPDTALLAIRVMRETAAVAQHLGIGLIDNALIRAAMPDRSDAEALAIVQAFAEDFRTTSPDLRPSILQDADRGRRLEVNETLGYTLTLAQRFGLPAPTLDLCCRVLRVVSRAAR